MVFIRLTRGSWCCVLWRRSINRQIVVSCVSSWHVERGHQIKSCRIVLNPDRVPQTCRDCALQDAKQGERPHQWQFVILHFLQISFEVLCTQTQRNARNATSVCTYEEQSTRNALHATHRTKCTHLNCHRAIACTTAGRTLCAHCKKHISIVGWTFFSDGRTDLVELRDCAHDALFRGIVTF